MRSLIGRVFLIFMVLMLISSTSFANLRKGKIGSGGTRVFLYQPDFGASSNFSLIFDAALADLDLIVLSSDEELVAVSFSAQSFSEFLQVGLPNNDTYFILVDSFEGPATPFRLVATSAEQGVISTGIGDQNLKEVELTSKARKVRDQVRKMIRSKK